MKLRTDARDAFFFNKTVKPFYKFIFPSAAYFRGVRFP